MTNTIKTITIHTMEVKQGKKSFYSSSALIRGKWYKIKFLKAVTDSPREKGLYDLTIDFDECSLEKGKKYTRTDGSQGIANDTIWVNHIVGLRKYTDEEMKEMNRATFNDVFGDDEDEE